MKIFSDRLKQLRNEEKLTQEELSRKCGISQASISELEMNKYSPTAETIVAFADFFDVSADYLLGRKNY